jgi:hypothetical protein
MEKMISLLEKHNQRIKDHLNGIISEKKKKQNIQTQPQQFSMIYPTTNPMTFSAGQHTYPPNGNMKQQEQQRQQQTSFLFHAVPSHASCNSSSSSSSTSNNNGPFPAAVYPYDGQQFSAYYTFHPFHYPQANMLSSSSPTNGSSNNGEANNNHINTVSSPINSNNMFPHQHPFVMNGMQATAYPSYPHPSLSHVVSSAPSPPSAASATHQWTNSPPLPVPVPLPQHPAYYHPQYLQHHPFPWLYPTTAYTQQQYQQQQQSGHHSGSHTNSNSVSSSTSSTPHSSSSTSAHSGRN